VLVQNERNSEHAGHTVSDCVYHVVDKLRELQVFYYCHMSFLPRQPVQTLQSIRYAVSPHKLAEIFFLMQINENS
jgi:hypothetical protein